MNLILVPISPGELIDKMTILEIKLQEITDEGKLKNINQEYTLLTDVYQKEISVDSDELLNLKQSLLEINKKIWESENDVREFWNNDEKFLAGAKQSHFYNDERAKTKRAINELLGSVITEEKSHPRYEHKA